MRIHSFLSPFKTGPENVSGFQGVGTVYFSKSGSQNPEGFQQDRKLKKDPRAPKLYRDSKGSVPFFSPKSNHKIPKDSNGIGN